MNNEFQWDDKSIEEMLVKAFSERLFVGSYKTPKTIIEEFKASHTEVKGVDWEIISFSYASGNATIIIPKLKNGLFHCGFEEVPESYCHKEEYDVHSVRRLSDNSVWTVGDDCFHGPIVRFNLRNDQITADFEYGDVGCSKLLSELSKPLQCTPLFKTEDGVDIFEGDWAYYVEENNNFMVVSHSGISEKRPYKYFSTSDKANEYILMNKPCLSVNDVIKAFEDWKHENEFFEDYIKQFAKQRLYKQ